MTGGWPTSSGPIEGELIAGRYRVERSLGRGGMSTVVAARCETTGAGVAIKILRVEGRVHLERFLREAELTSSLRSDHIVKLLEVGAIDDRHPFLVMERLEGSDLGARLRSEGPLPLAVVASAAIQTCEALAHAHAASIVHRDVKPSNLFCHQTNDDEIVKVLDFGISRRTESTESTLTLTTENGGILGSPPYMSPEHVRDPRKVDGRSDLWSLGVVMYRLLSGAHLFEGATASEIVTAIRERPYVPLRDIGVLVPPELDAVVARCLARPREDRFATAAELARALAPFATPRWAALASRIEAIGTKGRVIGDEPETVTVSPPESPPHVVGASAFGPLTPVEAPEPAPAAPRRAATPLVVALVLAGIAIPSGIVALRLSSRPAEAGPVTAAEPPSAEPSSSPEPPQASEPAPDPAAPRDDAPAHASARAPARHPAAPRRPPHVAPSKPSARPELYPSPYRR
ncbi:MAG: serine/threonine protein kinase [Labilithrix sp.]|nr:serine/threonine protein kinase [Labilithrix sp.]